MLRWSNIRGLGDNKIINRSYMYLFLVPALAKILEKVNSPLKFNIYGEEIEIVFQLPFSWQFFYFSALFFTIGAILYNLKAPNIIKENKSFGSFTVEKKNFSHLDSYLFQIFKNSFKYNFEWKDITKVLSLPENKIPNYKHFNEFLNKVSQEENNDYISPEKKRLINELNKNKIGFSRFDIYDDINFKWIDILIKYYEKTNSEVILEKCFWKIYRSADIININFLWLTFISYFIGILLMSWVIIQGVITVFKTFI